ncbi:MAG: hypothetical protein V1660_00440 [archaeon]
MKSTKQELQRKVNDFISDLDFSELTKEPTFKTLEEVIKAIKEKGVKEISEGSSKKFAILNYSNEICSYLQDYWGEIAKRQNEWITKSDNFLSKIITEETGMPQKDIDFIKKPFCMYQNSLYALNNIASLMNDLGIGIYASFKNKVIPIKRLRYAYARNVCEDLSSFYFKSIEEVTEIFGLEISNADWLHFKDNIIKEVILPEVDDGDSELKKKDIEEMINSNEEKRKTFIESEVNKKKDRLVRNIEIMDSIYGSVKRKTNSLSDYFEDHVIKTMRITTP